MLNNGHVNQALGCLEKGQSLLEYFLISDDILALFKNRLLIYIFLFFGVGEEGGGGGGGVGEGVGGGW